MEQIPLSCQWCGKFVVSVREDGKTSSRKLFEIFTDESGRLIKDESEFFYLAGEHRCRVICGGCGVPVIMEHGKTYDRPAYDGTPLKASERDALFFSRPHHCKRN